MDGYLQQFLDILAVMLKQCTQLEITFTRKSRSDHGKTIDKEMEKILVKRLRGKRKIWKKHSTNGCHKKLVDSFENRIRKLKEKGFGRINY